MVETAEKRKDVYKRQIDNRGDAIRKAIFEDCSNDKKVLLITGKGDETRQKIGKEYIEDVYKRQVSDGDKQPQTASPMVAPL